MLIHILSLLILQATTYSFNLQPTTDYPDPTLILISQSPIILTLTFQTQRTTQFVITKQNCGIYHKGPYSQQYSLVQQLQINQTVSAAVSSDGKYLAFGFENGEILVFKKTNSTYGLSGKHNFVHNIASMGFISSNHYKQQFLMFAIRNSVYYFDIESQVQLRLAITAKSEIKHLQVFEFEWEYLLLAVESDGTENFYSSSKIKFQFGFTKIQNHFSLLETWVKLITVSTSFGNGTEQKNDLITYKIYKKIGKDLYCLCLNYSKNDPSLKVISADIFKQQKIIIAFPQKIAVYAFNNNTWDLLETLDYRSKQVPNSIHFRRNQPGFFAVFDHHINEYVACKDVNQWWCRTCYKDGRCAGCEAGFFYENYGCHVCETGCLYCRQYRNCIQCDGGYFRSQQGKCQECMVGCAKCRQKEVCFNCDDGFWLKDGICVEDSVQKEKLWCFVCGMMVFGLLILKMSGILSNDRMKLNDEDLDIGKYNKSN